MEGLCSPLAHPDRWAATIAITWCWKNCPEALEGCTGSEMCDIWLHLTGQASHMRVQSSRVPGEADILCGYTKDQHTPLGSVLSPADWAIFLRPKLEGVTFLPSISLSQTKPELLWWRQGATWPHAPLCLWPHVSYFLFLCSLHSWAVELPPSCSSDKPGAVPSLGFCSVYSLCLDVYVHG